MSGTTNNNDNSTNILSGMPSLTTNTETTNTNNTTNENNNSTNILSAMSSLSTNTENTNTNDTNAIDNKRKSTSKSYNSLGYNILYFLISLVIIVVFVLFYFSYSGLILFICKLAQSNILPTELNCAPYTDSESEFTPKGALDIFSQNIGDETVSMKIAFPLDGYNKKNVLLDIFREYKKTPTSNFLVNYFIAITEQMICFNLSCTNTIMNLYNSLLPESVIIMLGPILFTATQAAIGACSALYFVYIFFSNMIWLFATNTNTTGEGEPKWEQVSMFSPFAYFAALLLVGAIVTIGYFGRQYLSILPGLFLLYSVFSCFFYRAKLNDKPSTAFKIIINTLKLYKLPIVILSCVSMIILSFLILGIVPGIFSIITLLLMYTGVIPVNIFSSVTLTGLTPATNDDYAQAKKTCTGKPFGPTKSGGIFSFLGF